MTAGVSDAGLATERTALAWRRTAIAAMATAVLFGKAAIEGGFGWRPVGVLPLCAAAVMVVVAATSLLRSRKLRNGSHRGVAPLLIAVTTAVAVVGVATIVMIAAHPT